MNDFFRKLFSRAEIADKNKNRALAPEGIFSYKMNYL